MQLPRDAVEYATVTFTDYPDAATLVEASVDRRSWVPFDVPPAQQPDGTWAGKVLLRGPFADGSAGLLVPFPGATLWARVIDDPEVVPVPAGDVSIS